MNIIITLVNVPEVRSRKLMVAVVGNIIRVGINSVYINVSVDCAVTITFKGSVVFILASI